MRDLRSKLLKAFEEIHQSPRGPEVDCMNLCSGACEGGAILLVPFENEYLSAEAGADRLLFPSRKVGRNRCGFIAEDEPDCWALAEDRKTCCLYPRMPVDCLTYPVFPRFLVTGDRAQIELYLSHFCPLHSDARQEFIEFAKATWLKLFPYLPPEWMTFYNDNVTGFFSKEDVTRV
jgi:hypothetical protein